MARVEFRRPWPPLQPPARVRTAARRDKQKGIRSLPWEPYRAAAVAAVSTGMAKALRARSPLGHMSSPRRPQPQRAGGGGGATRSMSTTDVVACG